MCSTKDLPELERGWHHINTEGVDISAGERYAEIEPFYNGQALVRSITGEYLVIDENGNTVSSPVRSESDINQFFNLKPFHIGSL